MTQRYGVAYILTTMALCFFGVEVLVLSFFYREVISVGLVAIAIWPIMSTMRKTHFVSMLKCMNLWYSVYNVVWNFVLTELKISD